MIKAWMHGEDLLRLWLMTPRFSDIPPFLVQRYEDMETWKQHPLAA